MEYARQARLQPRRLRLHDVHRQLGPAARADRAGDRGRTSSSSRRCCRATATSRGASIRSRASTISRRRRSSSRTRSPGGWTSTSTREPIGVGKDGPVFLRDIWPAPKEVEDEILRSREGGDVQDAVRGRLQGRRRLAGPRRCRRARRTRGSDDSTYVKNPPYFEGMTMHAARRPADHRRARARRCSATRSRPTTSRRPATSRRRARPASGSSRTA